MSFIVSQLGYLHYFIVVVSFTFVVCLIFFLTVQTIFRKYISLRIIDYLHLKMNLVIDVDYFKFLPFKFFEYFLF